MENTRVVCLTKLMDYFI